MQSNRFATFVFLCLFILPILGLVIMNDQLTEANSLTVTGNSIKSFAREGSDGHFFAVVMFFLLIFAVLMTVSKFKRPKKKTLPDLNSDIRYINNKLNSWDK